ncbi:MAG TPA: molybdopterin-dependent oxidoreductase [Streptosporangiaceae bacterium]|nr:molybdopterin-dependent oxidoreductase [Streptosporangiaceae bacterium]
MIGAKLSGAAAGRAAVGAMSGLLAAAAALGVAQLVAGITGPLGSPVVAVGEVAINLTPVPVKDFVIAHVGSHDKQVLVAGILMVLAAFAALTGMLAQRRLGYGLAGLAVFGLLGAAAAITRPNAGAANLAPAIAGIVVGAVALTLLARAGRDSRQGSGPPVRRGPAAAADRPAAAAADRPAALAQERRAAAAADRPAAAAQERPAAALAGARHGVPATRPPGRRRFLALAAGTAAVAAAGGLAGQSLLGRFSVDRLRAAIRLPTPANRATAVPAGAQLPIRGITPFFTSNASFYRVDTELVLPQIAPDEWTLRVHGMVDRPLELSFGDLLRRPLTEADITLACVSNQVGGPLAGNARWLGASLRALLREAGVQAGADQILSTSNDGWTAGTPTAVVMSDPDALLAVGMNGQPLPVAHGFPARMMVPGLFGYASATKWVTDIELTTFAAQRSYWVQRGYSVQGPIKTMSRIDVPRPFQQVHAGRTPVAGVAWAPHRGIERVQVSADGGPWYDARLAAADGVDTWRQWVWYWDATPGLHQLQVRATDGTGATQPARRTGVFPNGATGWDSAAVTVT